MKESKVRLTSLKGLPSPTLIIDSLASFQNSFQPSLPLRTVITMPKQNLEESLESRAKEFYLKLDACTTKEEVQALVDECPLVTESRKGLDEAKSLLKDVVERKGGSKSSSKS